VPSSVLTKYILGSFLIKSNEKPAANLKFIPSFGLSLLFDYLFNFINSIFSNPFFIDHSNTYPSLDILTNVSSESNLPFFFTHYTSHTASLCFPDFYLSPIS